ncbi:DUF3630 family protein [Pandoraea sputorum]|uniref:DUF3630 family protein n=1 Tax=Pandoraea sputorum TaxID=93222 RepID=UPI002F3EB376
MKTTLETSPTGFRYISVQERVDWGGAPSIVEDILSRLGASDVMTVANDDAVSVDTKWWNFTFDGKQFRVIYEEYPRSLSIEPMEKLDSAILADISRLLLVEK